MKKIIAKSVKIAQQQKQAGLKQWGMAGALGLAALNGGKAKADFYDGNTQGNKAVAVNATEQGYDESKLTPSQKARLDAVKRLHNDADDTNNKAFIQQKIHFLQRQAEVRKNTLTRVQQKITQATKAGNLQDAMAFKNYADKVLNPQLIKLQQQIKELKGQVQHSSENTSINGSWSGKSYNIIIDKNGNIQSTSTSNPSGKNTGKIKMLNDGNFQVTWKTGYVSSGKFDGKKLILDDALYSK